MCLNINGKKTRIYQRKRLPIEVVKELIPISGGRFQSPYRGYIWDFRRHRSFIDNKHDPYDPFNVFHGYGGAFHFYFPPYRKSDSRHLRVLWVLPRDVAGVGTFCGDRSIAATACYTTRNGALRAMKRKK